MVPNTAYGLAGRWVDHGVAAMPSNGEEILARLEGGKKGKQVGEVPHQRIVLQGSAAIGSRWCSGGFGVVQQWSTSLLRGDS